MKEGDDNSSATVRNRVHKCAYYQAKTNDNSKRQSGYSQAMKVEPVWLSHQPSNQACKTRSCIGGKGGSAEFFNMGQTCQGYLWPYDNAYAEVICPATPNYKVTLYPSS